MGKRKGRTTSLPGKPSVHGRTGNSRKIMFYEVRKWLKQVGLHVTKSAASESIYVTGRSLVLRIAGHKRRPRSGKVNKHHGPEAIIRGTTSVDDVLAQCEQAMCDWVKENRYCSVDENFGASVIFRGLRDARDRLNNRQ